MLANCNAYKGLIIWPKLCRYVQDSLLWHNCLPLSVTVVVVCGNHVAICLNVLIGHVHKLAPGKPV